MKKYFTLSALVLTLSLVVTSCSRNNYNGGFDESYWLSKEQGEVVYSDNFCDYYVVETYYGYTVIRSFGNKPFVGSIVYGNFSNRGTRDFYNYSSSYIFSGTVTDYWLTYFEAQDALDFYCPLGFGKSEKPTREFKKSSLKK